MRIRHLGDACRRPPGGSRPTSPSTRDDVIRMSITEVAEQTGASEGSIVGLCRRLGASGFQELKILLSRDLVEPMRLIQEDLRAARHRVRRGRARLRRPHRLAAGDAELLVSRRWGERSRSCAARKRVEVYGIGSAAPIAQDLGYRLLQLGYDAKVGDRFAHPGGERGDDRQRHRRRHHLAFGQHDARPCSPPSSPSRPAPAPSASPAWASRRSRATATSCCTPSPTRRATGPKP